MTDFLPSPVAASVGLMVLSLIGCAQSELPSSFRQLGPLRVYAGDPGLFVVGAGSEQDVWCTAGRAAVQILETGTTEVNYARRLYRGRPGNSDGSYGVYSLWGQEKRIAGANLFSSSEYAGVREGLGPDTESLTLDEALAECG